MAQEIFKRYEKKYMLTTAQYHALMKELEKRMARDEYGEHTISNIYFDTADFRLIRASIEKPVYKEKLRLRAYGRVDENSTVFIELKKKYDGIVYKRRVTMKLPEARRYLYFRQRPQMDSQILQEIDYTLTHYDLIPKAYVAYDRVAYYGKKNPELRVTFDKNIRCRNHSLDLQKGSHGSLELENGMILMEVKIPNAMPLWMSSLFSLLCIYPVSFSKYGSYYKTHLIQTTLKEGGIICA